jgi:hypothetical protein
MKDLNIQWILLGNEDPSPRKKDPQRITWTRNDQLSFCRALLLVSPHFLPFQAKSRKFTYFRISCFWEHSQLIDSVVLYLSPIFATYMVRATGPKSLTGLFVVCDQRNKKKKGHLARLVVEHQFQTRKVNYTQGCCWPATIRPLWHSLSHSSRRPAPSSCARRCPK